MNQDKLKKSTLFSYAATAIPLAMLGLPLYIYLPTFYAQSVGLSVTLVGLILFLSRLTDVITDPLVGIYNDRFQSKYGKRKPFMLVGALILIGSFYALIHPPEASTSVWLLGFSMLVYLGWSIISIPYLAWSAEISSDYHEKTRLSASRELFTIVGALSCTGHTLPLQCFGVCTGEFIHFIFGICCYIDHYASCYITGYQRGGFHSYPKDLMGYL